MSGWRGKALEMFSERSECGGVSLCEHVVAVLRRTDECQVVLRYDEVESRGAKLLAADAFGTLTVGPPAPALP